MKIWIVLILIGLSSLQAAERPSWCSGAKYQAEHIICQNEKFWELEERLMRAYRDAKERLDSESFAAVKRDQLEWVKERNSFDSKWMSIESILDDYEYRIRTLEGYQAEIKNYPQETPRNTSKNIINVFKNLTYDIDGKKITLRDGVLLIKEESASEEYPRYEEYSFDQIAAKGDLTGDGFEEYVIELYHTSGGSGKWRIFVVMQEQSGGFKAIAEYWHEDRSRTLSTYIKNRKLYSTRIEHGPNDASCCPSLKKNHEWKLVGKELQKIK